MAELIGRTLGQYTIIAKLGAGGMATVYRARQASVERDVAIKVIQTNLTQNPEFIKRFAREAQIVAALSHPHILKLFDFGNQGDLLYLVMELVSGGSLAARLKACGTLDASEVASYLEQIGKALDYAHARGVVHRDLKPQNVLLDETGNAILTDFGIVLIFGEATRMTASGMAMGTPSYMAPEQWYGHDVDGRADIYAMAVMTYELLTGELPFTGDTPSLLMYQHLNEPPPLLRRKRPDLPQSLEKVLLKGMAKRPEARFQSASEFARAFRESLSGKTPPGVDVEAAKRPLTPPESTAVSITPPAPRAERRGSRVLLLLGGLIIVALLGVIALLLSRETPTASPASPSALAVLPSETATMPTIGANDAHRVAEIQRLGRGTISQLAYSPDGRTLAVGGGIGVWLYDAADLTRSPRLLGESLSYVRSVAWSADGRLIASGSDDGTVRLWEAASGRLLRTLTGHTDYVRSVAWAADGRLIASGSDDGTVRLWEAESGRLLRTLEGHTDYVLSVAWSADGRLIASGSYDRTVRLWEAESGRLLRTLEGHTGWVRSVVWAADGRLIASDSDDGTVRLWEAESGRLLRTLEGYTRAVLSVAWSADGRLIASGSSDGTVRLWEAESGRLLRTLEGHTDWVNSVAWSADGRLIASGSADRTVRLWEAESGRLLRTLEGHTGRVNSVAWSADGRLIASGSADGTVRLWEAESGRLLQTLTTSWVNSVAWSADGRLIASGSGDGTVRIWGAR
jgi:WD40 repeat protein/serine/threonine protein kinase